MLVEKGTSGRVLHAMEVERRATYIALVEKRIERQIYNRGDGATMDLPLVATGGEEEESERQICKGGGRANGRVADPAWPLSVEEKRNQGGGSVREGLEQKCQQWIRRWRLL